MELIHTSGIDKMVTDQIELKHSENFLQLILENKAEYTNQSQQTQAGTILNETITARIKYTAGLPFLNSALKYYVIRLFTDSGSFLVGSLDYPAEINYNENKVFINLTFTCSKPI